MIVSQEHQCAGPSYTDLLYDASAAGWSIQGAQAHRTINDGISGGVAVAARKSVGRGDVHASTDHSAKLAPGRLSANWVQVGPDTGIVVVPI